MKHLIPGLFMVLVIVNGWGEEWIFASGLSPLNCAALASQVQAELTNGDRAECRDASAGSTVRSSLFPDFGAAVQRGAEARATIERTRRENELQQGALEEQRQRNELLRLEIEALK